MDMLSGSQISSFLSATSLVWASSIVLIMVGLVYFIKHRERRESIKSSKFFYLYLFTVILNILEFYMNIVMQNSPSYEIVVYKIYILVKFFWNISIIFYVINYIQSSYSNNYLINNIIRIILMVIAVLLCVILDIDVVLESNGKFYVLVGSLNEVYTVYALLSNSLLLLIVLLFHKKMPKGFCLLSVVTFFIYVGFFIFRNITGYMVKDSVFIYTILMLIIFNTTSNQDKEIVSYLNNKKDSLENINKKRSLLYDKITTHIGNELNDMALYNDELYLLDVKDKDFIKNDSLEIKDRVDELVCFLSDVKDIYMFESSNEIVNEQYQLNHLITDIENEILPIADSKLIQFNQSVADNSFLNYIGDFSKIKKIIINLLLDAINRSNEGDFIDLTYSSKQYDLNRIEFSFLIKCSTTNNSNLKALKIEDYIKDNKEYNSNDMKIIISCELLEKLNSFINIKTDSNYTVYSFDLIQGFYNNDVYNNIN